MKRLWRDPEKRKLRIERMRKACSLVNKNRRYSKEHKAWIRNHARYFLHQPEIVAKQSASHQANPNYREQRLRCVAIATQARLSKLDKVIICDRPNDYAGVLLESDFQEM